MIHVIDGAYYCCATCHWWKGTIGKVGRCGIPVTPSTVNCGPVAWDELCEQHDFTDEPMAAALQAAVKARHKEPTP